MNTHQQPSSKEAARISNLVFDLLEKHEHPIPDGEHYKYEFSPLRHEIHNDHNDIVALLTSYSEAIRERVEIELKRSWDKSVDEGTVWDLGNALEALALLNDSDGEKKYTDEEMIEMERNVGRMSY